MKKIDNFSKEKIGIQYTELLKKFYLFMNKYRAITLEYKKTRGVNLLEIHEMYEELIEIKTEYEIILYGILTLRNSITELKEFFMLEYCNCYKEVKAEKSYIFYFLNKVEKKYTNELLEESKAFAQIESESYLKKSDNCYIDIYKSIEEMEINIRKMILLKRLE